MLFFVSQQTTSAAFVAVHHFEGGPMVGVYGSSLPLGTACFHAPLAKQAGAFVAGGEVETCKSL